MRKIKVKVLGFLFFCYLQILSLTCKVRIINKDDVDINNSIIGFWHGESFPMYLLVKRWKELKLAAVVTSDSRGDYISTVMKRFNINPLRLPNGVAARHGINEIIRIGKEDERLCICFSIDGPLGPFHEPKKMVFHIAKFCNKKYLGIKIDVKGRIVIKSRWDKYIIPLPFSSITYEIRNMGIITNEQLKNYDSFRKEVVCLMTES